MKEVLQDIYIGRTSLDSIEFKYDTVEVPLYRGEDREFQIFIKNFAAPTSISFLPDDAIKNYLILVPSKHHIQKNDYVKIVVRIPYNVKPTTEGYFYIVTGYGAQKKGFKLSVGSDKNRSSTLSSVGDLSGISENPAGDIYGPDGSVGHLSGRAEFISEEEDEKKPKPAFGVKNNWDSGKTSRKGSSKSEKYPKRAGTAKSSVVRKAEAITPIEKISVFISLVLIVLLIAVFIYIQFSEIETLFNFDQTFLLALIGIGFIIFILLLLSMFLKRTAED